MNPVVLIFIGMAALCLAALGFGFYVDHSTRRAILHPKPPTPQNHASLLRRVTRFIAAVYAPMRSGNLAWIATVIVVLLGILVIAFQLAFPTASEKVWELAFASIGGLLSASVPMALVLIALLIYFIPAIVASRRNHRNIAGVIILNLLLGWTFLGWVAALVWASWVDQSPAPHEAPPHHYRNR